MLGVDRNALASLAVLAGLSIAALTFISRPLLFASLQPELAEARGLPMRLLSTAFLGIVAVAVSESAQIVGVLLVFTLMVGPGAASRNITPRFGAGVALSAMLAVAEAWGGLTLAWFTDWPVSFWITAMSAVVYGASLAAKPAVAIARASSLRQAGAATAFGPVSHNPDGGVRTTPEG